VDHTGGLVNRAGATVSPRGRGPPSVQRFMLVLHRSVRDIGDRALLPLSRARLEPLRHEASVKAGRMVVG
jgi:hypothetical protein